MGWSMGWPAKRKSERTGGNKHGIDGWETDGAATWAARRRRRVVASGTRGRSPFLAAALHLTRHWPPAPDGLGSVPRGRIEGRTAEGHAADGGGARGSRPA